MKRRSNAAVQTSEPATPAAVADIAILLQGVVDAAFDPTLVIDAHGDVRCASRSLQRVFGVLPADIVGRPLTVLLPDAAELASAPPFSPAPARPRSVTGVRADGAAVPLEASIFPIESPGAAQSLWMVVLRDVRERVRAESALTENEVRLRSLADTMPHIIWAARADGRVDYVNRRFYEFTGASEEDNIHWVMATILHPDDFLPTRKAWRQAVATGTLFEHEYRLRGWNRGAYRWVLGRALPVRDASGDILRWIGTCTDVDVARRAQDQLRLIQGLAMDIGQAGDLHSALTIALQRISEATGWEYGEAWLPDESGTRLAEVPIWHTNDPDLGEFEEVTRHWKFRGGVGLPGLVLKSHRSEWVGDLAKLENFGRAAQATACGLRAALAVPILSGEHVAAVILFFMRNPTEDDPRLISLVEAGVAPLGPLIERKRAQDELTRHLEQLEVTIARRNAELEATHERLRHADRLAAIGTLAAGLGHDMNNLLLPLRCRLDTLKDDAFTTPQRQQLHAIRHCVEYLQQLADGLHLMALDPEDGRSAHESTRLHEWWKRLGPLLARSLPTGVVLETDLPEDLPPIAVAPHRLTQAVLNLIVNAGEAVGSNGRVRITAGRPTSDGLIPISVSDNGCGMSEEVRRQALDPFFTTKKRGLSTGLGLSLVQGVVRSTGGTLAIDSRPGRGTTITLGFPAARATDASALPPRRPLAFRIRLADERLAGLVASLLNSAGASTSHDSEHVDILATDEPARPDAATAEPVVIAFNPAAARPGDILITDPEDFQEIRSAVTAAITEAQRR